MKRQEPWPVKVMCRVLGVSTSGYFRWQRTQKFPSHHGTGARLSDAALLVHIRAIHVQLKGEYGWPRMRLPLFRGLHSPVSYAASLRWAAIQRCSYCIGLR